MRWVSRFIAVVQFVLFVRFMQRVLATLKGASIPSSERGYAGLIAVIVPVLNEVERLEPCLRSLADQDGTVREIVVVDGGSTDGTQDLIRTWESVDDRIRLIETPPAPDDWNGKAWGLQTGLDSLAPDVTWVLTVDADVRCKPGAAIRVALFADTRAIPVLSVACTQVAKSPGLALVHPSLLSTLVYRFGAPGTLAVDIRGVQSNGQFGLYRREALVNAGGFNAARDSICEDVTLARHLYLAGYDVGFYEGEDIAETEMYESGFECLRNWPRSLSLRDRILPYAGVQGLLGIIFLQVIPLILTVLQLRGSADRPGLLALNRVLAGTRLGILVGTRRAYSAARWTYWISPLLDPIALGAIAANLLRRSHTWRGRHLVPGAVDPSTRKGSSIRCV